MTTPARRFRPLLLPLALLLLAALAWTAYRLTRPPDTLSVWGESEFSTRPFTVQPRRYALSADLLPTCQYTLYLTPEGKPWDRAGKAIASVSGENGLEATTDVLPGGRYFIHSYTNPEEGCSWTLRMTPR